MADRLTAAQMAQLTGPEVIARPYRTLEIDAVDYSAKIIKVGRVKWVLTNPHPRKRSTLRVPILTLELDNQGHDFTVGSAGGAWATAGERRESVVEVAAWIGSPQFQVLGFTGSPLEPFYNDDGTVTIGIQHAVHILGDRVWKREDADSDFETGTTIARDAS